MCPRERKHRGAWYRDTKIYKARSSALWEEEWHNGKGNKRTYFST